MTAAGAAMPVRSRIAGIDMARALAIIGMVMVHIGPDDAGRPGLLAHAYRWSHGRASILFVVLAGIGVSMLAGDRSRQRLQSASARLVWRAMVLLPAGLALQETGVEVAVILQHYACYFVVAIALMRLPDRVLMVAVVSSATAGPVLYLWLHRVMPAWFEPAVPHWYDVPGVVRDIVLTGSYPVVVWVAPLAFGIWLGRRALHSRRAAVSLLAAGIVVTAAGFTVSNALITQVGLALDASDWRQLIMNEPHDNMPLWLLTSGAIATALIGGCLLLAERLPRLTWPLVAFGQLAFTAYVLHLLVLRWLPQWLARDALEAAWRSTVRFTVIALLLSTAYRAVAARGPFELLLRPPAWWRPGRAPTSQPDASMTLDDGASMTLDDGART